MAILNVQLNQIGEVGVLPSSASIQTNDTEAVVLTTGYLNRFVAEGNNFNMPCIAKVSTMASPTATPQVGWYQVSHSGANWSLVPSGAPGDVTLPTIANHLAVFSNTTGTLKDDVATAINGGNIQAGLSGTAGYLASFPGTASKGSLHVTAVANTGDTLTTISNAAMGQASVVSIPDPGAATANFILSANGSTQTISTGSLALSVGTLTLGSSGHASSLTLFPGTAANGTLIINPVNAGAPFNTTISNGTMGQSSVVTIPDPGAATAKFVLDHGANAMASGASITFAKVSAAESGNAVTASGSAGVITTSSLTTTAGSSYAITWTNTAITATSSVQLTVSGGTNTRQSFRMTVAPGSGTATLTIYNNEPVNALNGTILISYLVM